VNYNLCEKKLQEWLNKKKYPYHFIDRSRGTFLKLFGTIITKQSDYLLVLQQIRITDIDIKEAKIIKIG